MEKSNWIRTPTDMLIRLDDCQRFWLEKVSNGLWVIFCEFKDGRVFRMAEYEKAELAEGYLCELDTYIKTWMMQD